MTTFATLFTGIGGWDEGLRRAGLTPLWGCEIAPFPRSVLAKHLAGILIYDDITKVHAPGRCGGNDNDDLRNEVERECRSDERGELRSGRQERRCGNCITERPDILVASPPCQDLSVAGRRAGLAGVRSGLFFDFTRLAGELRPSWVLMEQVPGLFSSNDGRDFDIALAELEQLGYGLSWRTFDARFFGVPQRRRRVYVVGHLGGPCPPEVLFESEGSSWNLAPSDEEGEDPSAEAGDGVANPRGAKRGFRLDLDNDTYVPDVAYSVTARERKGVSQREGVTTLVGMIGGGDYGAGRDPSNLYPDLVHTLRASGHDASEDGTGRGTPLIAETLTSGAGGRAGRRKEDDVNLVAYRKSARMNADPNSPETWVEDGIANTLNGFDVGDVRTTHAIVAMRGRDGGATAEVGGDQSNALRSSSGGGDKAYLLTMREGKDGGGKGPLVSEEESLTLSTSNQQTLFETANVRRLTPRECERLMGFPDDWTAVDGPGVYAPRYAFRPLPNRHDRRRGNFMRAFWGRKRAAMAGWRQVAGTPDGPRYAACGNAVVVEKAEWIGRSLLAVIESKAEAAA